jgi:hypothetical protein
MKASGSFLGRKKVKNACVPCTRSKLGCDQTRPCRRCLKRGIGDQCIDKGPLAPVDAIVLEHADMQNIITAQELSVAVEDDDNDVDQQEEYSFKNNDNNELITYKGDFIPVHHHGSDQFMSMDNVSFDILKDNSSNSSLLSDHFSEMIQSYESQKLKTQPSPFFSLGIFKEQHFEPQNVIEFADSFESDIDINQK